MELERKVFETSDFKVAAGDEGIIEAIVSTYSVDRAGEKVMPGAFTNSLARRRDAIPIVLAHDWATPIGKTLEARETPEGLYVKGQLNLDIEKARDTLSNLKKKVLTQFSFGYRVVKDSYDKKTSTRNLEELEIFEVSPVLVGMQSETRLISAKGILNTTEASAMSANLDQVDYKSEYERLNERVLALESPVLRPNFGGNSKGHQQEEQFKGIGKQFVESREFKNFRPAGGSESESVTFNIDIKTLMTTLTAPPETTRSGLLVPSAQIQPNVVSMLPRVRTTQNSHIYLEETTFTNAVDTVAEGQPKPEISLGLTEKTAAIRKLAGFLPITDETIQDTPSIMDYVDNRLMLMCAQKLEAQVLSGNGVSPNILGIYNTPSILSQPKGTDATPDAIRKAITQIRVTGKGQANGIVIHPNDWQEIQLLRTTDGIYIWGNPWEAGLDRVWGLPVLQSDAAVEGTAIVADFRFTLLIDRQEFTVKVGYSGDDWIRNRRSVIGELRAGFVVLRPSCVCLVTGI